MPHGDIVDKLLDQHRFPHAGTAEETNLSATAIRREQVNHLDARNENFSIGALIGERRRFAMDRIALFALHLALAIDAISQEIHYAPQGAFTYRHRHRAAQIFYGSSAHQTDG